MCRQGHQTLKDNCRACRELKAEWYQYLSNTGFEDIENGSFLKGSYLFTISKPKVDFLEYKGANGTVGARMETEVGELQNEEALAGQYLYESKVSYYQWARSKLNDGRFDSEKDKLIWEYHAEGLSTRQISPRVGLEQSWIVRKINKIKSNLKEQMETFGSASMAIA